jgi:hypothetical protein
VTGLKADIIFDHIRTHPLQGADRTIALVMNEPFNGRSSIQWTPIRQARAHERPGFHFRRPVQRASAPGKRARTRLFELVQHPQA